MARVDQIIAHKADEEGHALVYATITSRTKTTMFNASKPSQLQRYPIQLTHWFGFSSFFYIPFLRSKKLNLPLCSDKKFTIELATRKQTKSISSVGEMKFGLKLKPRSRSYSRFIMGFWVWTG